MNHFRSDMIKADGRDGVTPPSHSFKSRTWHAVIRGSVFSSSPKTPVDSSTRQRCALEHVQTPTCGKGQPYISLVVDELIMTERSYVKDLRDIVHVSIL